MANELDLAGKMVYREGGVGADLSRGCRVSITGTQYLRTVQNIGTSEEALDVGSLDTLGYCMIINRDPTNFVEIRPGTGVQDMIKVSPGKFCIFEFADLVTAPYAIADTAACDIEILIIEV